MLATLTPSSRSPRLIELLSDVCSWLSSSAAVHSGYTIVSILRPLCMLCGLRGRRDTSNLLLGRKFSTDGRSSVRSSRACHPPPFCYLFGRRMRRVLVTRVDQTCATMFFTYSSSVFRARSERSTVAHITRNCRPMLVSSRGRWYA